MEPYGNRAASAALLFGRLRIRQSDHRSGRIFRLSDRRNLLSDQILRGCVLDQLQTQCCVWSGSVENRTPVHVQEMGAGSPNIPRGQRRMPPQANDAQVERSDGSILEKRSKDLSGIAD